jgi:LacI family transcriptional regulator
MSIVRVADHAGVSTATVSRVLNNLPGVRAATAAQVKAAMKALNYDPSQRRRWRRNGASVSTGRGRRTGAIAIITLGEGRDWLQLPVMAASASGISRAAQELGYRLLLEEAPDPGKPLPPNISRQADGAIVFLSRTVGPASHEVIANIARALPIVWAMGGVRGGPVVDHVAPHNQAIGHLAFEYLKARGCRDVAYLTKMPAWPVMRARGQAFCCAAHDDGARCASFLVSDDPRDGQLFGADAVVESDLSTLVGRLVATRRQVTGLFVSTDETTVPVHGMLRRAGLRLGKDLHIISCDNEQIRLAGLSPRPATIDPGAEEVGWRAVHRLVSRIEHPDEPPVLIQVAPRLVEPEPAVMLGAVRVSAAG